MQLCGPNSFIYLFALYRCIIAHRSFGMISKFVVTVRISEKNVLCNPVKSPYVQIIKRIFCPNEKQIWYLNGRS